jgi:multidrug efflux pump subunit AcrA (membrane-fusion protein)
MKARRMNARLILRDRRGGATIASATALVAVMLATGGGIWWWMTSRGASNGSNGILLHTVERDDFELTVTERGEVEAFDVTEVRSLVKSNNTTGNAILRIVPEGTEVKKGDFLVELDSSALRTQRTSQKILVNAAKAAEVEAKNTYDTAVIAKREYLEGTNLQERQLIESEMFVAEENLNRAKEYYAYSQKLASKGYVNELQLEADRFAVEKAKKDLDTAKTKLHVLDEFTKPKMLSTLESAILIAKAKWDSGQNSHELELDKLKELDDQIAKCTLVAPEDGIVKYAHVTDGRGDQEFIVEEGTVVRERQVIITLPNADSMRVSLMVNESLIQYVKPGLGAVISPVGFGDRVLLGSVERVNQYAEPTGWRQANVKEYKAQVSIDHPSPELRAGMTAAVTIRCAEVPDALQVPVQAVYAHGRKLYCFVYSSGGWEAREIKPGPTNDKFFVVESGLNEGDQVAMNPRGYVDEVQLPKLSPEEAQRAVPQRGNGRGERGPRGEGGQRPGELDESPGEQPGLEQPGPEQPQLREPDGTDPGDTRAPAGSGAAAQADQTASSDTAGTQGSGSGAGE